MHPEALVFLSQLIQVLLQQNILGVHIRKDQIHLGAVTARTAADDGADDLQHRSDASATCDHTEVTHHVGRVDHGALRALDFNGLANDEACHVLADVTSWVGFDEQVEVARDMVAGDWRVGTDDLLLHYDARVLRVNDGEGRGDGDVLSDWEAEDGGWCGEGKAVAAILLGRRRLRIEVGKTDIATLWEMMVFSLSSNSWKVSGFRTFLTSEKPH